MTLFQQGDLLLKTVGEIPSTATFLKGEAILHPGNTGNNHTLNGAAFGIFQDEETKYVDVAETATLSHNEHKTVTLPAGKYRLDYVQEYDHFNDLQRAVVD